MLSALPVSGSPSKEERVLPNTVAARWPVPPEYLASVPDQERQGGPHKKQSESFHTYLHADVGGRVRRVTVTGVLAAAGQGQTARR
jgi:hypothetical protein